MSEWLHSAFSGGAFVGHLSYILLIVSMLMDRLVLLRLLAISSGVVGALYFAVLLGDPVAGFWEVLLVLANLFQLALTASRNRLSRFDSDETVFHHSAVPGLAPSDVRRLLRIAKWRVVPAGTTLTRQNEQVAELVFIIEGDVEIAVDGAFVARCGPGQFVGEIGVTGGIPATATAVATTIVRGFVFEASAFRRLISRDQTIGHELELAIRLGLREKLVRANQAIAALGAE